jgi:hypothetical protein
VVVAVGLMLVEPLADADVNVPGVMATLVAPVAAQLNVLVAPEFMLVGFAEKELIVGAEPFPSDELDELVPQPASPTQTASIRSTAERCSPEESSPQPPVCAFPHLPLGVEVGSLDRVHLFGRIPSSLLPRLL